MGAAEVHGHHDHEHGREGHDGHGHQHGHDHHEHAPAIEESFDLDFAHVDLESHEHEGASTVSLKFTPSEGASITFAAVVEWMVAIACEVEGQGGVVGHVKATAQTPDGAFAHASVTAGYLDPSIEGRVDLPCVAGSVIQMAVIALLVDEEALVGICKQVLAV